MKNFSVKHIVATGIGAALFFVLGRFVAIPSGIPNTNISIQYGLLAFIAAVFGPIAGLLSGLIGHFFIDFSFGWGIWWSWVIASAICGGIIGFLTRKLKIDEGEFDKAGIVKFNFFQLVAHLISWAVIAPVLDILIYDEPANKVFVQGLVSAGVNVVTTAVVGTLLCIAYAASIPKKGSLKEED
ncbi:MAG: ECF-type riboflavin transporter substrate-binding protein [Lachnospiraceae bacterium]|nr:ECF-type riboflavin transporter substrate-binding protein [Lachnospiraceae bacterium]MBR6486234.1 ECF-type riboflavin transporter substrate-binding protein [Lachnospiraceae bacterium]